LPASGLADAKGIATFPEGTYIVWQRIWRHRLEFYPYISILLFWLFGSALGSLAVKNRPGIVTLGIATIVPVGLIIVAVIKTYRELPETGTLPGPEEANNSELITMEANR